VTLASEPGPGRDERGRHALEGPPQWIAEQLTEYVEAGCDGFVVNLGHDHADLYERLRQFAEKSRRCSKSHEMAGASTRSFQTARSGR
jgi:alkanesulfonate monooxygenase SsuD/methylene tetrahydromethanopterin reductase-like flavin-dependent oxidoreductase (luciferase family)